MIDEVNKFIVRNSINKISTPTLNCAMPQTKIRGQTPVLIRCSGRSFCFALSPSTLDLRLQPVLFFMFNSFLFGVVSFPFQNIQVQQRKKNIVLCRLFSIARKRQNPKLIGTPNRLYREKNEASLKT